MRRSVWRKSKEPHAGSVPMKRRSGQPGVCSHHRLERSSSVSPSFSNLILTLCPGGFSWGRILTQEPRTGCTEEGTLTGITLTAPTFIDTGGAIVTRSSGILLIFATCRRRCRVIVWVEEKLIKYFKFSRFTTVNSSAQETCKRKENFRVYLM